MWACAHMSRTHTHRKVDQEAGRGGCYSSHHFFCFSFGTPAHGKALPTFQGRSASVVNQYWKCPHGYTQSYASLMS